MSEIINKVDEILKREDKLSNDFGELSKIYLMTTENIKGFLENQTIKDLFVSYPIKQMPLKYKVAYTGIKHRNMLFLKAFKKKI